MFRGRIKLRETSSDLRARVSIDRDTSVAGVRNYGVNEPLHPFAFSGTIAEVILDNDDIGSIPRDQTLNFSELDLVFLLSRRLFHAPVNEHPWTVKNGKADAARGCKEREDSLRPQ